MTREHKLHYTLEFADNGVILRDVDADWTEVHQYGDDDDETPCKHALGTMIYNDMEDSAEGLGYEYNGFDIEITIKPIKP
jgi:hypothetical protein